MTRSIFLLTLVTIFLGCKSKIKTPVETHKNICSVQFKKLTDKERNIYTDSVNSFYKAVLKSYFSGGILVAKNGEIIFEAYNGIYNTLNNQPVSNTTPIHIASVSKTFTSIAILKLYELGKLKLEDSLEKYFPLFPYHGITVKELLNHRSGLPNYLYCMDTAWKSPTKPTNYDVLNYLIERKPAAYAAPNRVFHYCNTNYVLLALIIEKLSNQSYPDYMQQQIFKPLGMTNTFVFSSKDTANYIPSYSFSGRPFLLETFDCTYGDKNIYSTARDLYKWDQALYCKEFIQPSTLDLAFAPYSNERPGHRNYGLGWRLYIDGNSKTIYHNGWWHGNNASFTRLTKDSATIIVIGNKYNRSIYTARQLSRIFSNKDEEMDYEE